MISKGFRFFCFVCATLLAVSCTPTGVTTTATNTAIPIAQKTEVISSTSEPKPTNTPSPIKDTPISVTQIVEVTATPSETIPQAQLTVREYQNGDAYQASALSTTGPWLVFTSSWDEQGLEPFYISNLDGSGITHLFSIRTHTYLGKRFPKLSPNGLFFSVQSMADLDDLMGLEKEIVVYQLPDKGIIARFPVISTSLITALNEIEFATTEYMYSDEFTSIKASGDMLWSPNSRYLAYTAAVDGATSDIYVFDTKTLTNKRLTDGLTQASLMAWSPDSQWIIHFAWEKGDHGMDGSAMPAVKAIWAVSPVTGNVRKLDDVRWESINEQVLGWASPDTFVTLSVEGSGIGAPSSHIRKIHIPSSSSSMLYEHEFYSAAYDPVSDTLALVKDVYSNNPPGLYILSNDGFLDKIDDRAWYSINWLDETDWLAAENWYVEDENFAIFSLDGSQVNNFHLEKTQPPEISPDGELVVFIGKNSDNQKGIRIYDKRGLWLKHILPQFYFDDGDFFWKSDLSGFWFVQHSTSFTDYGFVIEYSLTDDSIILWQDDLEENFDLYHFIGLVSQ